jgi:mannose-6-phosphate isomerase-like protein (cupin superfamily)
MEVDASRGVDKTTRMLTLLAFLGALAQVPAQSQSSAPVVTAAEWAETLKKSIETNAVDTLMKGTPIEGGQASVAMLYRTRPETRALIHDHATEIYFILEGSGTLITGGTLKDIRESDLARVGAGLCHSGEHVGGTSQQIKVHDIVIIPGGMAHRFSVLDTPIKYLVSRFDPSKKLRSIDHEHHDRTSG